MDKKPWGVEITNENMGFNHCTKITTKFNDSVPKKNQFDLILANISPNVLLQQIPDYPEILGFLGDLLISGFYVEDLGIIQNASEAEGFRFICNFKKTNGLRPILLKMSTDKPQIEKESELDILTRVNREHEIILFNDDVNTFDHVIETLVAYCDHSYEQAEQCAYIVHYSGKCVVKTGSYEHLEPICNKLLEAQLSAEIH